MKKLIIFVLLFGIVSVSITGIFINKANKNDSSEENNLNNEIQGIEKTLDLNGRYNTNDLLIEYEENTDYTEFVENFKIPQIKGLKDKTIEEKINFEIKNTILDKIDKITKIENLDKYYQEEYRDGYHDHYPVRVYIQENCNFANVFSLTVNIDYDIENNTSLEKLIFNYELVNGEKLKLEDLFVKDADITSMLRKVLYKVIAGESSSYDSRNNLYYDIERNMWVTTGLIYDEENRDYIRGEKEYIPFHTEDKVNEKIKNYMQKDERPFEFTETTVNFVLGTYDTHRLYFKDVADEVVIYDKYLARESDSIFERNDIGKKGLWTCTKPRNEATYQNYGFASDNVYYDITLYMGNVWSGLDTYPFKDSYDSFMKKLKEISMEEVEKYRELANENKDKFYIISMYGNISFDSSKVNNIISAYIPQKVEIVDLNKISKEEIMTNIMGAYRYWNVGFYPSAFEYFYNGENFDYEATNQSKYATLEKSSLKIAYDARTMKKIESVDELFKQDTNYKEILKNKTIEILSRKYTEDEVNEIMKDVSYDASAYGLFINVPEKYADDYTIEISFSEFDEEILNIYDLELDS